MTNLQGLDITDIRARLPRQSRKVSRRSLQAIEGATLHYYGPTVKVGTTIAAEIAYFAAIANGHIKRDWGGGQRGDGIMYHLGIAPSGRAYWLRDFEDCLWHCGNSIGNARSIAVHLAIGGAQHPTAAMWQSATQLFDAAGVQFRFARRDVLGHREWPRSGGGSQSACPGPIVSSMLRAWRDDKQLTTWRVTYDLANVREGPCTDFPIALKGKAVLKHGQTFRGDGTTLGQLIGGSRNWIHLESGIGFVHDSLLVRA